MQTPLGYLADELVAQHDRKTPLARLAQDLREASDAKF
jgi:hypothetical protein